MITNKQKIVFSILGFVAAFIGIIAILPFEILLNRLGVKVNNIEGLELVIKFIVLPVLAILMSLYGMKIRKDNYYEQLDLSVGAIKMGYIPLATYLAGLLGWISGVIYASIPYDQNMIALIQIMAAWGGSAFLIFLFGIYTNWLYKLNAKGFLITNIIFIACSVLTMVGVFFIYKNIPEVVVPTENNAFMEMLVYTIGFFAMILFLWKSLFSNQNTPVVLGKDEKFTDEEEAELIIAQVDEDVQIQFEDYYAANVGSYIEELLELEAQQFENAVEECEESVEETVEEVAEETVEEVAEETVEEVVEEPVEEVAEETIEEVVEEASVENVEDMAEAVEELSDDKTLEEAVEEQVEEANEDEKAK